MNYLQKKELDTLKKQGYDIVSVQKGIALALGAKPEEKVAALLTEFTNEKESNMTGTTKNFWGKMMTVSAEFRGLDRPKETKLDASILTSSEIQYMKDHFKGVLRDIETEISFTYEEIKRIKSHISLMSFMRDGLHKSIAKSLIDILYSKVEKMKKKRNKLAQLQTKLKRIKVSN